MNKANVLRWAIEAGCDTDGDILYINGKKYYVHIMKKIVEEVVNDQ